MRLKASTVSALPTTLLLVLLLLDIAKPGYRKVLLVPEFKSQMAKKWDEVRPTKKWDEVRPTVETYLPQQSTSATTKRRKQTPKRTSPFQQWIAPTPTQLPPTK
jgi:hypothetical protein